MILAVDIGNTRIKCAVFENNTLKELFVFYKEETEKKIKKILEKFPKLTIAVSSSVVSEASFFTFLENNGIKVVKISHESKLPFVNAYLTPNTLGIDRIVLAAGATLKYPKTNILVIDAGTCITYDFISKDEVYFGGAISPGLQLRANALHQFTSKLPLIAIEEPSNYVGNSTNQAILSGVVFGVVHEIEGFIAQYCSDFEDLTIILTGGDAIFLAKYIKNTIFAHSNFLLESLNALYNFTKDNDDK